jgi:hypothetical protein
LFSTFIQRGLLPFPHFVHAPFGIRTVPMQVRHHPPYSPLHLKTVIDKMA